MNTAKSELSGLVGRIDAKRQEAIEAMRNGTHWRKAKRRVNPLLDQLAEGSGELRRLVTKYRGVSARGREIILDDDGERRGRYTGQEIDRLDELHEEKLRTWDAIREAAMEAAESAGPSPARAARSDGEFAQVVAAHEAGHACWHLLRGRDVDLLQLEADWGDSGRAQVSGGRCFPAGESRDPAGHFSGFAAERLLGHRPSWDDGAFDGDIERARRSVDGRLDKRKLAREAERKLRPHRKAIEEIADELAERGELPGRRARRIWERHQRRSSTDTGGRTPSTGSGQGYDVGRRRERTGNRSPAYRPSRRRSDGFASSRSRRW